MDQRGLDSVSLMLGKMQGVVDGLERYIHEFRHDENNRRQVDQTFQDRVIARLDKFAEDMAALRKADNEALAAIRIADREEFNELKADVDQLKAERQRREGVLGAIDWLLKSPLAAWLFAAALAAWTYLHRGH